MSCLSEGAKHSWREKPGGELLDRVLLHCEDELLRRDSWICATLGVSKVKGPKDELLEAERKWDVAFQAKRSQGEGFVSPH